MYVPYSVGQTTAYPPFSFCYFVDNRISTVISSVQSLERSVVNFIETITLSTSNRTNRLRETYDNEANEFCCSVQILGAGEERVMRKNLNIARLDEIAQLQYDWNGYGAKEFSKKLIEKCKQFMRDLPVSPDIYPTGRQSIQFQYELADKSYLEFEIFETKTVYLQVPQRRYSAAITEEFSKFEIDRMKEIVNSFYGQSSDAQ